MDLTSSIFEPDVPVERLAYDLESRYHLLNSNLRRGEVMDLWEELLAPLAKTGLVTAETALLDPSGFSDSSLELRDEIQNFYEGLRQLSDLLNHVEKAIVPGAELRVSESIVEDQLEDFYIDLEREKAEFMDLFLRNIDRSDPDLSKALSGARKQIADSLYEVGSDRMRGLADAMEQLSPVINTESGTHLPFAWLDYGWLCWQCLRRPDEAESAFFKGFLRAGGRTDLVYCLLARYLAYMQFLNEQYDEAFNTIKKALNAKPSVDVMIETIRYGVLAEQTDHLRAFMSACFVERPLSVVQMLGDPMIGNPHLILECAIESVRSIETSINQELLLWRESSKRLERAEKSVDLVLELPGDLRDGFERHERSVLKRDYFRSRSLRDEVATKRREFDEKVDRQLDQLLTDAQEEHDCAKNELEKTGAAHQALLQAALARRQEIERFAREEMKLALPDEDKAQQGCSLSAGLGCGGFILYVMATIVLQGMGVNIDPQTPVGKIILMIVAIPLAFGGMMQIVYNTKRMAVESEMLNTIARAEEIYQQIKSQASRTHQEKMIKLKETFLKAEKNLAETESKVNTMRCVISGLTPHQLPNEPHPQSD